LVLGYEMLHDLGLDWNSVHVNPFNQSILAIDASYSGSAAMVLIVDFSDPNIPFRTLGKIQENFTSLQGWSSKDTLTVTRAFQARVTDGKRLDELSEDERQSYYSKLDEVANLPASEWNKKFPTPADAENSLGIADREEIIHWNVNEKLKSSLS